MADHTPLSGAQVRRQVLGDEYVDRTAQIQDPLLQPFFQAGIDHVWGGLWNRPGLELKYRNRVASGEASPSILGSTWSAALLNCSSQYVVVGVLARTATMSAPSGMSSGWRSAL
jgi:hypothetical protein